VWDNWYFEPNRHLMVAEDVVDPKYRKPSKKSSCITAAISYA